MKNQDGFFALLPTPVTPLPREKPIPEKPELTKWQQYAQSKGIKKNDKNKMVYDKFTDEFRPRVGFQRANDPKNIPIMEAKGDLPEGSDPFIELQRNKRKRMDKEEDNMKENKRRRESKHLAGDRDLKRTAVEFQASAEKNKYLQAARMSNKDLGHIDFAYDQVRMSTASMGKFDKKAKGESVNEKKSIYVQKNKQERFKVNSFSKEETSNQLEIANRVNRVQAEKKQQLKTASVNSFQQMFEHAQSKRKKQYILAQNKEKYKKNLRNKRAKENTD